MQQMHPEIQHCYLYTIIEHAVKSYQIYQIVGQEILSMSYLQGEMKSKASSASPTKVARAERIQ